MQRLLLLIVMWMILPGQAHAGLDDFADRVNLEASAKKAKVRAQFPDLFGAGTAAKVSAERAVIRSGFARIYLSQLSSIYEMFLACLDQQVSLNDEEAAEDCLVNFEDQAKSIVHKAR